MPLFIAINMGGFIFGFIIELLSEGGWEKK